MHIWDAFPCDHYLSLVPWASLELESGDTPRPFPFIAGVAPEVLASLHEAHQLLYDALMYTIYDMVSGRAVDRKHQGIVQQLMRLMETRSEEHTSELQSRLHLVCRL